MQFSLTSYQMLGRACAVAHRQARDTGDSASATILFKELWNHLDRESLSDHCEARQAFNVAFGNAYRGRETPAPAPAPDPSRGVLRSQSGMIEGPDPDCDPPAPAPAPRSAPRRSPSVASVALDCAAFFAKQEA